MARDREPVTDETLAAAKAELQALREEVREDLAADLGGDPDDYCVEERWQSESDSEDGDDRAVPNGGG